jgi:hypothetical protein
MDREPQMSSTPQLSRPRAHHMCSLAPVHQHSSTRVPGLRTAVTLHLQHAGYIASHTIPVSTLVLAYSNVGAYALLTTHSHRERQPRRTRTFLARAWILHVAGANIFSPTLFCSLRWRHVATRICINQSRFPYLLNTCVCVTVLGKRSAHDRRHIWLRGKK